MRDWQAKTVYAAEDAAIAVLEIAKLISQPTLDEARHMVEDICEIEGFKPPRVEPLPRRCRYRGDCGLGTIRIAEDRITDWLVIHELAHHITPSAYPAHGAEWCQNYLRLLHRHLGHDHARIMREHFDRFGVHYTAEDRVRRVRRVAVNFANNDKPRVRAVFDGPQVIYGKLTFADKEKLVIDEKTYPMAKARYITRSKY